MRKRLLPLLGLCLLALSACDSSNNGAQNTSLAALVHGLFAFSTNDTATPVDLTQIALDNSSESPTDYNDLFAPGG